MLPPYDYRPRQTIVKVLKPAKRPRLVLALQGAPPLSMWRPRRFQRESIQLVKLSDMVIMLTLLIAISACAFSAFAFGQSNALVASAPAGQASNRPITMRPALPTLTPTLAPAQGAPNVPVGVPPAAGAVPQLSAAVPSSAGSLPILPSGNSGGAGLPAFNPSSSPALPSAAPQATLPAAPPATLPPAPGNSNGHNPIKLPTLPPGAPAPTATSVAAATPVVTPTATTAPPAPTGWSFASVRLYPGQQDGLLLYGKVTNETGSPQELEAVSGLFFDEQGQLIADRSSTFDYWPVNVVPPGGSVPFALTVFTIQSAAKFDLNVEAQPSEENARQDFDFANVNPRKEDDDYCVSGELRNNGDELQDYLVIVAILYDGQGNVVNFDYYDEYNPDGIRGDDTSEFDICVPPPNQETANFELRAWGR
ncbi:MAG: FxLYD domain-containing protein [Anaerolineae bacterium]